jgi:hypothetical protein
MSSLNITRLAGFAGDAAKNINANGIINNTIMMSFL